MSVAAGPHVRHHLGRQHGKTANPRKPTIYLCEHCLAPVVQVMTRPVSWQHGSADWAACGNASHSPLPTLNSCKEAVETQHDAEAAEWSFERDRLLQEIDELRKHAEFCFTYLDQVNAGRALTTEEWDEVDRYVRAYRSGSESERIWDAF